MKDTKPAKLLMWQDPKQWTNRLDQYAACSSHTDPEHFRLRMRERAERAQHKASNETTFTGNDKLSVLGCEVHDQPIAPVTHLDRHVGQGRK